MTRLVAILAVLLLAPAVSAAGAGLDPPAAAASRQTQAIATVTPLEREVLVALNDVRRAHGLVPLQLNAKLAGVAREHSYSMAEHGYFRHDSYDGTAFWRRIEPVYPPLSGHSWGAAENMLWASPGLSAERAVDIWMHSPEHRKNMLTPSWREIGIGGVHALAAPGVYQRLDVTILTADFGVR